MALPNYADCDYSLFVSYAHSDDAGNNGWIGKLKRALWDRLTQLPRDIPRHNLHLATCDRVVAGRLGDELKERVRRSFGMLMVVGPQYVSSGWCEKELEFFEAVHGADGFAKRLYIVAMTEDALNAAKGKPIWARLLAPDQAWLPMYSPRSPSAPLEADRDDGTFAGAFWREACTIGDKLIKDITANVRAMAERPPAAPAVRVVQIAAGNPAGAAAAPIVPDAPARKLRVAIGAATNDLYAAIEDLRTVLVDSGELDVDTIPVERVVQWEKDGDLAADLQGADAFIVPYSEAPPLYPKSGPGGHLAIQASEWARLGKKRRVLWYRPLHERAADAPTAADPHLSYMRELSPVYASSKAIGTALLDADDPARPARVTLYIEKNPNERSVWKILGRRMGELWEQLGAGDGAAPLRIATRSLDIDKLDPREPVDNADGVVLLLSKDKHPKSLEAQMRRVEDSVRIGGPVFPGFVAVLVPPHDDNAREVAEHGWDYFKFQARTEPPPPSIKELRPEDTADVMDFLREIRAQRMRLGGEEA